MNDLITRFKLLWNNGHYREALREVVIYLFAVDSIGSVFTRGALWFGITIAIIVGMDSFNKNRGEGANVKTSLGFFLLFLILGGGLIYLLFGFAPFLTTVNASSGN